MARLEVAVRSFGDGDDPEWFARLGEIKAPTLVANGDREGLFPAIDCRSGAEDQTQ
jgi:hypothetical protein